MVGQEVEKELVEKVYEAIEISKKTGKIRKGSNEVTKALEKGTAKLVAIASDITPPEVVMHLPVLSKEKEVPCIQVGSKVELGAAAGLPIGTSAIAIVDEGEAKKTVKEILADLSK
ncbi:50S ribosomal protein L7ae [Candidatus Woesearchaeota archaeon]|jgi:large subunit ribosomal protein L7Ae|nr:50S ribosomal protein L7ae [Candidatus Woesearchaeota archaeon]MBT6518386.1 50S ribosomal protein L7ae [Candidatus Woesearchaeota archaeon]MBT7366834.1 50S ribosomal protein L7ae [Candidatus Woesearchaeota archaeon]